MLTVRIRPNTSVNPDATTNSKPANVSPSSSVTMNSPGSSIAAPAEVPWANTSTHSAASTPTTTAAHVAAFHERHERHGRHGLRVKLAGALTRASTTGSVIPLEPLEIPSRHDTCQRFDGTHDCPAAEGPSG